MQTPINGIPVKRHLLLSGNSQIKIYDDMDVGGGAKQEQLQWPFNIKARSAFNISILKAFRNEEVGLSELKMGIHGLLEVPAGPSSTQARRTTLARAK